LALLAADVPVEAVAAVAGPVSVAPAAFAAAAATVEAAFAACVGSLISTSVGLRSIKADGFFWASGPGLAPPFPELSLLLAMELEFSGNNGIRQDQARRNGE
jgi:hypothetical protein